MDQRVWEKQILHYENSAIPVAVYLKGGIKLRGTIHDHDDMCLLFDGGLKQGIGSVQLIKCDAIATVTPLAED